MEKARILVQGIVQGVGFRPTVYRIADEMKLNGYVRNLGNSVEIILEGKKEEIKNFAKNLKQNKPPISKITHLEIEWLGLHEEPEFDNFMILESSADFSGSSVIPPDVAICDKCLEETLTQGNKRYKYPFTACTDCGPRFTVIKSIPYDRVRTSMDEFPLCDECMVEYRDPLDRRYHAEATCCPTCGPSVFLYKDEVLNVEDPIKEAAKLIDEGNVLAIKGIGGTHLVAKTTEDDPVITLRKRLGRMNQPFACMSPDIETIKTFAEVRDFEEETLISRRRPIVVLNKNSDYYLAPSVSPDLHNLGVMLPYSGLQHLLFQETSEPAYIMTSANIPGEPMLIDNEEIVNKIEGIADYCLLHDRKIINRCDDSVIRFRAGDLAFIRRSRGYVPEPYDFSNIAGDINILALGPELDVTFALLKDKKCYVSQHIGNTTKYETYKYLQEAIDYMIDITRVEKIDAVACDLHPMFFTTKLAHELSEKFECDVFGVQHHHAHAGALFVDHGIDELICIAADGVGYGDDGSAWGGEILHVTGENYNRLGSLMPQNMAGGDLTTKYPIRMVIAMLHEFYEDEELKKLMKNEYVTYFKHGEKEIDLILKQLERGFNIQKTTSTGRVLDALSSALGICGERTYEGECAMKLESVAYYGADTCEIPVEIKKHNEMYILNTSKILLSVLENKKKGMPVTDIACSAQRAVAEGLAKLGIKVADKTDVDVIGGTGGVFYNETISKTIKDVVTENGYDFIQHKNTCAGDGSVSLGQAAIAALHYKTN
ncbi:MULTISPECIES: carbamoyltransferase HypF [Methanobacterium]|jgi:hydrogenase maturation protein HypF|uniref:Carbamoyltransferase n=1 Tax=Methanobacterium veterum TaxID=408577 RepID=A0A9E5A1A2_9EURY|nr:MULTISPECIES: carbamoyltransferase HypF [Methanobacterium]MCZ3365899.1 carbamoyltransferase HypF [Methanobacterium veterum]MCZ3371364.1 carbamoyltransferase HypF [Methanobacterium veterum]